MQKMRDRVCYCAQLCASTLLFLSFNTMSELFPSYEASMTPWTKRSAL
jgi:hypothetical protein